MPPKDSIFKYSFYARTDTGEILSIAELQNVTLTEADEMLEKIDYVRVVRCKDCKHRPIKVKEKNGNWLALPPRILDSELEYADDYACPCLNSDDYYYSWNPDGDWYCPNGERREP